MNTRKYLLRAEDIEKLEAKKITHFLNPNGTRLNKSLGDAVGMSEMGVHMIYVEPNQDSTEFHKHLYEEECIYVISGSGKLTIESDEYDVSGGDFIGLSANGVHRYVTNSPKLIVWIQRSFATIFAALGAKVAMISLQKDR